MVPSWDSNTVYLLWFKFIIGLKFFQTNLIFDCLILKWGKQKSDWFHKIFSHKEIKCQPEHISTCKFSKALCIYLLQKLVQRLHAMKLSTSSMTSLKNLTLMALNLMINLKNCKSSWPKWCPVQRNLNLNALMDPANCWLNCKEKHFHCCSGADMCMDCGTFR